MAERFADYAAWREDFLSRVPVHEPLPADPIADLRERLPEIAEAQRVNLAKRFGVKQP